MGTSPVMSDWMKAIPWLGFDSPRKNNRTRAWHTFKQGNIKVRFDDPSTANHSSDLALKVFAMN